MRVRVLMIVAMILAVVMGAAPAHAVDPPVVDFTTVWKTSEAGATNSDQIMLPLVSDGAYNFEVSWGDSSTDVITRWDQDEVTHTYPSPGTYTVTITGTLTGWAFRDGGDARKIIDVSQWGNVNLGNTGGYFFGAWNVVVTATDAPDLSGTTNMSQAFSAAYQFEGAIEDWDTRDVTTMSEMFLDAKAFNRDIGGWDTGNVTDMSNMFRGANPFNQDIGGWDTGKVTNMASMFFAAMDFNQDIGDWDTGRVSNMYSMFRYSQAFNQDLSRWNTGNVVDMSVMFGDMPAFNQNLGAWDVSQVQAMDFMFSKNGMSADSYSKTLMGWAGRSALRTGVSLRATTGYECVAAPARKVLTGTWGWQITDGGVGPCANVTPTDFGGQRVGTSGSPVAVTVANLGGADTSLPAEAVSVSGPFSIVNDDCSNTTLASGTGTCTVMVRFSPTAPGPAQGTLTVSPDTPAPVGEAALTGSGTQPAVGVSSKALSFSPTEVGQASGSQSVTLTNVGDAPAVLGAGTIDGPFTRTSDSCSGVTLPPAAECTIAVSFSPQAEGNFTGSLTVPSDAPGSPTVVLVSGVGFQAPTAPPVAPPPSESPRIKQTVDLRPPKRIKKRGLTVLTPAGLRTNAGQSLKTRVRGRVIGSVAAGDLRTFSVVRGPRGKVSVRTFGRDDLRLVVRYAAPATKRYTAYRKTVAYVRGTRR